MIELKPFIEMLEKSLPLQEELDTRADWKRLKKIMPSEAEWSAVSDLTSLLEPFDDVTKIMLGSSYPTMSIVFPTVVSLKKTILDEANYNDNNEFVDGGEEMESDAPSLEIELIDDSDLFGDGNANYEDASDDEDSRSPIATEGIVAAVRKKMAQLFVKYYNVSQ